MLDSFHVDVILDLVFKQKSHLLLNSVGQVQGSWTIVTWSLSYNGSHIQIVTRQQNFHPSSKNLVKQIDGFIVVVYLLFIIEAVIIV